jgi:hypothetical protein
MNSNQVGSQDPQSINLQNSTGLICESCKNDTFIEVMYVRKISKLMTGSAEDTIVPIPTLACAKCTHVNEAYSMKQHTSGIQK